MEIEMSLDTLFEEALQSITVHKIPLPPLSISEGYRYCTRCGEVKLLSEFYSKLRIHKCSETLFISPQCKSCSRQDNRERYWANPEKARLQSRLKDRRKVHGMTEKEALELENKHNRECEICGTHEHIAIDHCHRTNKRRGFLCVNCNLMLGNAHDSITTLSTAIEYLRKHGTK